MMVIMWFSGLRGAIAYALSLHLEFEEDVRKVIVTTTLVVVLFTTICLGENTLICFVVRIACMQNIDFRFITWNNIHASSLNQEEEHYHQSSISKERNQLVVAKSAEETKSKSQCPKQESWDLLLVITLRFLDSYFSIRTFSAQPTKYS